MPVNSTLTVSPGRAGSRPTQVPVVTTVPAGTMTPWRVAWRSQVGSSQKSGRQNAVG